VHVLSELDDAESSLRHVASNPRGVLRVDMHGTHATRIVLPKIDEFRARYPRIDLVVSSGDRLVDLVREGVDCVIRAGNPRDSSLVLKQAIGEHTETRRFCMPSHWAHQCDPVVAGTIF
jgi:DNA-binding transcriptional LysR family regulator